MPHLRIDALPPRALINSLMTGALVYAVGIVPVLAFAAVIFSGPLSSELSKGLGYALVGSAILCATIAVFSSCPASIAMAQDAPAILLAVMASNVVTTLPSDATPPQQFATVVLILTMAAVTTGLLFLLLGIFKLAGLVRFLPFPVMGGFLAGTGWLLAAAGVGVMVATTHPLDLFQPAIAVRWVPGALLGLMMLVVASRINNSLVLPGMAAAAVLVFYVVAWLSGTPQAQLAADGWLLGPFPSGSLVARVDSDRAPGTGQLAGPTGSNSDNRATGVHQPDCLVVERKWSGTDRQERH